MRAKSIVVLLTTLCIFLGWRLMAQTAEPQQSVAMDGRELVATDADIQLLRQDLRTQKQKLIAQNLPMTESEAVNEDCSSQRAQRSVTSWQAFIAKFLVPSKLTGDPS